nr:MAG TPA: 4Fe-4S dicluster domain protein [Caudoviricetes sp.]
MDYFHRSQNSGLLVCAFADNLDQVFFKVHPTFLLFVYNICLTLCRNCTEACNKNKIF